MQIITYQPVHQSAVIELVLHIQHDEFGLPITLADQPDLLEIPAIYQQGNGNFWVALDVDRVVGTIAAIDIGDRQLALRKMFVAAPYRGTPDKVGQQLLDTLRRWAAERDIADVYLGTVSVFKAAHRFYEKNGFQRVERTNLPASFPTMQDDELFYRLSIQKHERSVR